MKRVSHSTGGFTLIEMLVVVTIIVLLLAFSTPALMRTMQSSRLTSAGDSLMGAISEAQQIAYALNVPVEVRFFSFAEAPDTNNKIHSYQMFKVTLQRKDDGSVSEVLLPVNSLVRLPEGIVIVPDQDLSPPFSGDGFPDTRTDGPNGYSGVQNATYHAFRFMTDGSCRTVGTTSGGLASLTYEELPKNCFTLTIDNSQAITAATLPKNFYTIQVDPFTGKTRNYKPGF